jgi:hypothetical protein
LVRRKPARAARAVRIHCDEGSEGESVTGGVWRQSWAAWAPSQKFYATIFDALDYRQYFRFDCHEGALIGSARGRCQQIEQKSQSRIVRNFAQRWTDRTERGGLRASFGIGLLGVVFGYALGADSRLIRWLFVIFGFLLILWATLDGILWNG